MAECEKDCLLEFTIYLGILRVSLPSSRTGGGIARGERENRVGEAASIGFGRGGRILNGFAYGIKEKKIQVVMEQEKLVRVPGEMGCR